MCLVDSLEQFAELGALEMSGLKRERDRYIENVYKYDKIVFVRLPRALDRLVDASHQHR